MAAQRKKTGRLVYSTDSGRMCPDCGEPVAQCACRTRGAPPAGDGIVRLYRETSGRAGKPATVIRGLPLDTPALKALAKTLKQKCGVGGTVKADSIEIQGDQREKIKAELEKNGYRVKIAGG